ncbi:Nucleotide-diphospho-sugar transferase [Sesbania bispinosa]|nr:Nucleotide-diphospho-sugar transferase [Sesbania bispinosa]
MFFVPEIRKDCVTKLEWKPSPHPFIFGSFDLLNNLEEEKVSAVSFTCEAASCLSSGEMILKSLSVGGSSEMKIQKMLGDISNTQPYSLTDSIQNLRSEIEEKERETTLLASNPTDDRSLVSPLPQALLERLKKYGQEEVIVLWQELSPEERDLFVKKIKSLDLSRIDRIIRCFLRSRPASKLFGDEEVQLWKPFRDKLETIMVMLDKRYIDDSNFTWFRDTHKVFDNLSERLTVNMDVLQMWVMISNFKLAYNLLRRPDGTFNSDLAELLDRNVSSANTNPVDGVFSFDVIVDRETNLLTRIYRPAEGEDSRVNIVDLENPVTSEVLPVIIFFHGGSFAHSSANSAIYDTPLGRYPCAYEDEKRLDGRYFVRVQDRDCHQVLQNHQAGQNTPLSPIHKVISFHRSTNMSQPRSNSKLSKMKGCGDGLRRKLKEAVDILLQQSPLALAKALKNPVELDGLKKAHIRDGASIVQLREKEAETQDFIGAAGGGFARCKDMQGRD